MMAARAPAMAGTYDMTCYISVDQEARTQGWRDWVSPSILDPTACIIYQLGPKSKRFYSLQKQHHQTKSSNT